jgi:hypothetical protein
MENTSFHHLFNGRSGAFWGGEGASKRRHSLCLDIKMQNFEYPEPTRPDHAITAVSAIPQAGGISAGEQLMRQNLYDMTLEMAANEAALRPAGAAA